MMESYLCLIHYGRCLSVKRQWNRHISRSLLKSFQSVQSDGFILTLLCHTKHSPTADLQQQNNSQLISKDIFTWTFMTTRGPLI